MPNTPDTTSKKEEWRYAETKHSAVVIAGAIQLHPRWGGLSNTDDVRAVVRMAAAAPALYEALKEILNFGVEFDDARMVYVVAQVDRESINEARAALALADAPTTGDVK